MVRPPLSAQEHARGERLGMLLREARGQRSMTEIAAISGVPTETLRKIETGRIVTPAFFTIAALAAALGLSLEEIARHCAGLGQEPAGAVTASGDRAITLR
jgi:transcriptional regulator with XRE-family HTH domain